MSKLKKILIVAGFLFQCATSHSQLSDQNYFFQEVGWTITVPMDFALLDLNNYAINEGDQEEDEMQTGLASMQTMVVAIKDRFNYFNVSLVPFDEEDEKSWSGSTQSFKEQVYKSMARNMGRGQIDTASSVEIIDGLAFDKFHLSMTTSKGLQLEMFLLSKLYKGYDFAITYLSLNEGTKKDIEFMLKNSRFN